MFVINIILMKWMRYFKMEENKQKRMMKARRAPYTNLRLKMLAKK